MPVANFVESVVVYDDVENASNPQRKHVDWKRSATGLVFEQVYSERFLVTPGSYKSPYSVPQYLDFISQPVDFAPVTAKSWYQARWAGGGYPPGCQALGNVGQPLTCTAQADGGLLISGTGLGGNTALVGEWVYLAGSTYGDTGVVGVENQGFWVITATTDGGTSLYLRRAYAEDPAPVTETVTVAAVENIQYTQDTYRTRWANISAYGSVFGGVKSVVGSAIGWVAFATETSFVPTSGVMVDHLMLVPEYVSYLRVESDKPLALQIGDIQYDTVGTYEVTLLPVKDGSPAWHETFAFTLALALQNRGRESATVNLIYGIVKSES